jgi:hypothetical protein
MDPFGRILGFSRQKPLLFYPASSSHYLTVNVPYVHLLPEYRPQLNISLPPEDDHKFLACCILSENLPQFHFGELPHHPLEIIWNGPTSRNSVDLNQVSVEARQLVHLYLSKTLDSGTCGQCDWNVRERHRAWSAVLDKWSVTLLLLKSGNFQRLCRTDTKSVLM